MDMMLDQNAFEFLGNNDEGIRYAKWKCKQLSKARKLRLAEARREEELRNEADYLEG